jgi:hypothetical protein
MRKVFNFKITKVFKRLLWLKRNFGFLINFKTASEQ